MNIREILEDAYKSFAVKIVRVCHVVSVDKTAKTCVVKTLDTDIELTDVKLMTELANGLLLLPKVGSAVITGTIDDRDHFVMMYGGIDEVMILDGSYGGLCKTQELKAQLDKTNEVVQAIVDSLKNWVVVPNDGGGALKTYFNTQLGIKQVGDYSQIENEKVTHGSV